MKFAYLSCAVTLPSAPNRREDGYEHDQMMAALRPAFEAKGAVIHDIAWDDPRCHYWHGLGLLGPPGRVPANAGKD